MPTLGLDFNQDDPQMTIKCIDALAQSGAQLYRKGMSCCLPGGAHEDGHGARCTLSTESDSSEPCVHLQNASSDKSHPVDISSLAVTKGKTMLTILSNSQNSGQHCQSNVIFLKIAHV